MARFALLFAMLLAASFMAASPQPPDPHYLAPSTSAVARKSVFVHGYLHGYEEGFHLGNLDLQMGRGARDIGKCKEGRDPAGYRREFGDKHSFARGYREGVRVGYADAFDGRAFRAVGELKAISALAPDEAPTLPDPVFDKGFALGYVSGQQQGVQDGRRAATFTTAAAPCPATPPVHNQPAFCAAYAGGYRVGYSDGFINVARSAVAQAEVRGGGN